MSTTKPKPNKPQSAGLPPATIAGLSVVALVVIALVVLAITSSNNQRTNTASPASAPTNSNSSNGSGSVGQGTIPQPLTPADNTKLDSLDAAVTFTWQRILNPDAHYNLQLQYSDDGSNWQHTETVYDLLNTKYTRQQPFLAAKYAHWRVWATINQQDGDASDWFTLELPAK